jgi:hypothetical protein
LQEWQNKYARDRRNQSHAGKINALIGAAFNHAVPRRVHQASKQHQQDCKCIQAR